MEESRLFSDTSMEKIYASTLTHMAKSVDRRTFLMLTTVHMYSHRVYITTHCSPHSTVYTQLCSV